MIKKISALVLALVLCFSIVVVPASALSDGMDVKYRVELDKEFVNPGDTVTVSLYLEVADDKEWGTGAFVFGMNSAVFSTDDNAVADVKASTTMSDLALSFYKNINSYVAWQTNATILNNISTNNTAAENELYDQYIKVTFNRAGASGSHDNSSNTKQGLPSAEINADYAADIATFTFDLVVRDDVAVGTPVNVGITTGSIAKTYTYYKYLANPGSATTLTAPGVDTSELVAGTATVGEATVELAMTTWKQQIKFGVDKDGVYNNTFSARTFVEFTNFSEVFDDAPDALNTDDGDGLLEVGFVYKVGDFDEATAKGYVEAGVVAKDGPKEMTDDGYTVDRRAYVSTTAKAGGYVMGSTIADIPVANKTTNVTVLAYAKYTTGGEPVYVYHPVSGTFETLYNTYYSQAFPG